MKRNFANAIFPLSVLLVLLLTTFWLRQATRWDEEKKDGKTRYDPDYILKDAKAWQYDEMGKLSYTLVSPELRHYPDTETTELTAPHLTYQNAKRPTTTIRAEHGLVQNKGERVDLTGQVIITRAPDKKRAQMQANMDALTVFPNEQIGQTQSEVLITEGNSWVRGIGMKVNSLYETYELQSQVKMLIEMKSKK